MKKTWVLCSLAVLFSSALASANASVMCGAAGYLGIGKNGTVISLTAQDGTHEGFYLGHTSNMLVYRYSDEQSGKILVLLTPSVVRAGVGTLQMIYPGEPTQTYSCSLHH